MVWYRLRPTFDLIVDHPRATVIEKLQQLQQQVVDKDLFLMFGEYGELHLPSREHRLWSPHLSFYVSDVDNHTLVHGRFAPRVDIWTVVWIAYLVFIFTAFFGVVLGFSQWMLGEWAWGLVIGVCAILCWVSLYVVANVGQQWSSDQMEQLREKLESLLSEAGLRNS